MTYNVLIRTDGSPLIGMGHVRRCLSLAHALSEFRVRSLFAMQDLPGIADDVVKSEGFTIRHVPGPLREGGPSLPLEDAAATVKLARECGSCLVVIDTYDATSLYIDCIAENGLSVAVIDDTAERRLTSASVLINQNIGAERMPYQVSSGCLRLLGPAYALLRRQFFDAKAILKRAYNKHDGNLLIALGGGETTDNVSSILAALEPCPLSLHIRSITSGDDKIKPALPEPVKRGRHKIETLHNVVAMASHMAWADVSINAGGSTCWELSCLGVPMIVVVLAENQRRISDELELAGCALNLGAWNKIVPQRFTASVLHLFENPCLRKQMSCKSMSLIDGEGALRVASALSEFIS